MISAAASMKGAPAHPLAFPVGPGHLALGGAGGLEPEAGGLGGGVLLADAFRRHQVSTLGLGKTVQLFEMPWSTLVPIALLGITFTMVGAAFPLVAATFARASEHSGGDIGLVYSSNTIGG